MRGNEWGRLGLRVEFTERPPERFEFGNVVAQAFVRARFDSTLQVLCAAAEHSQPPRTLAFRCAFNHGQAASTGAWNFSNGKLLMCFPKKDPIDSAARNSACTSGSTFG